MEVSIDNLYEIKMLLLWNTPFILKLQAILNIFSNAHKW